MTDTPLTPDQEADLLAAEYVLGTLPHAERLAAQTRMTRDPAFAAAVAAWEQHLAPLNDAYTPAPAPNLLPQIEARLFPKPPRRPLWHWLAGAAAAATIALATVVYLPQTTAPQVIATLGDATSPAIYEARHDGSETLTVTRIAGSAADAQHVHELWIIAPGAAPVSLGLLDQTTLTVAYPAPPAGWTLAVTLEPAGGAPQGIPTGPVVLSAEVAL